MRTFQIPHSRHRLPFSFGSSVPSGIFLIVTATSASWPLFISVIFSSTAFLLLQFIYLFTYLSTIVHLPNYSPSSCEFVFIILKKIKILKMHSSRSYGEACRVFAGISSTAQGFRQHSFHSCVWCQRGTRLLRVVTS